VTNDAEAYLGKPLPVSLAEMKTSLECIATCIFPLE